MGADCRRKFASGIWREKWELIVGVTFPVGWGEGEVGADCRGNFPGGMGRMRSGS